MLWLIVFALLGIIQAAAQCPLDVDPCSIDVYTELDEPSRSTAYDISNGWSAEHDYFMAPTWYRSVSGAGGDMPTEPMETGQCDAYAPIWLNGSLPGVDAGIVDLQACASFLLNPCVRDYIIPTKNCGDFNVYCLVPVEDTYDRYCMGTELVCPDGLYSENGFTPGCEECSHYNLDHGRKRKFTFDVIQADDTGINFKKTLNGSDKVLKIGLEDYSWARINITVNHNNFEEIRALKVCANTAKVQKVSVKMYGADGTLLEDIKVNPRNYCFWEGNVQGVNHIELSFKKKRGKSQIKLSEIFIEGCKN